MTTPTLSSTLQTQSEPSPVPSSNSGDSRSSLSIIIILILSLIAGGGYVIYRIRKKTSPEQPTSPNEPLPTPTPESDSSNETHEFWIDAEEEKAGRASLDGSLIFISSKSADYQYAYQIFQFLTENGYNIFFSQETLPQLGNSDYRKEIDKALELSLHMIVVASSIENIESPWVEAEWGSFINEKRSGRKPKGNLITLIIGSLKIENLPISLRSFEVIPFDPNSFEKILKYLN